MRPLKKSSPGDTVSYMDSQGNVEQHIVRDYYTSYGDAKMPLVGDIGQYCSYCECPRDVDALGVEHLAAKSKGGSETAWDNFLLSCTVCNSCKGVTIVDSNYHWPHINNTFLSFKYDETGRIRVNPEIPAISQVRAENLLKLIHLERFPQTDSRPSAKDFRWRNRYETWNRATRYRDLYLSNCITEDDVINQAKDKGCWSVWFTVFSGVDAILFRLISDFPGTCSDCFDEQNHYVPLERNPGKEDPV